MTLTLWPTTSCSSRASRARSSATAVAGLLLALALEPRRRSLRRRPPDELAARARSRQARPREDGRRPEVLARALVGVVTSRRRAIGAGGEPEAGHGLAPVGRASEQEDAREEAQEEDDRRTGSAVASTNEVDARRRRTRPRAPRRASGGRASSGSVISSASENERPRAAPCRHVVLVRPPDREHLDHAADRARDTMTRRRRTA